LLVRPHGEQMPSEAAGDGRYVVAIAGNPNTGKSTVFNALTGLKQHTGNWPGKTVARAEGVYSWRGARYRLVDLPGTYSLLAMSADEEIARDFLLFGQPDCTIVVLDATAVERNLNLALQVLEITERVVVCLNLMDEAQRAGIVVDVARLEEELGVPVVPTAARHRQGLDALAETVHRVATGAVRPDPRRTGPDDGEFGDRIRVLQPLIQQACPGRTNTRWIAMRLLEGDESVRAALLKGTLGDIGSRPAHVSAGPPAVRPAAHAAVRKADELRAALDDGARDEVVQHLYARAERIARAAAHVPRTSEGLRQRLDGILTSPVWGLPIMGLGLAAVFWVTVTGANVPSQMIASALFWLEDRGSGLFDALGAPWWLTGLLWHGTYRALAWVVSVMLPPMAIFFPIFTILEDFGFLPRVAFNLDRVFRKVGAHGKMALTMCMGFGCNAAGVTACRVIDSPRERLLAILTNNFVPCNGRFPTLIMLALVFVSAAVPPVLASFAAAGAVVATVLLGVLVTLAASWLLSRTVLRGEASYFILELPPYRPPRILQTLYTSLIDRTAFVLYRAVVMAAPAGAVIWLGSTLEIGGRNLTEWVVGGLDPFGRLLGLDGVILFAYVVAIPANEIVVPTIIMTYLGAGMMLELDSLAELRQLFVGEHGWTLLTAVNLMLFSLLHNPCSTTILTMWKETRSAKWTAFGALMPLGIAFLVTFFVATAVRVVGAS
jgi:ferrous iron transport protein B